MAEYLTCELDPVRHRGPVRHREQRLSVFVVSLALAASTVTTSSGAVMSRSVVLHVDCMRRHSFEASLHR